MPNLIDLSNQRFGTFTVRGRVPGPAGALSSWWLAVCDCGVEREVRSGLLRDNSTRCCNCDSGRRRHILHRRLGESLSEVLTNNSEFITECGCQIWMGRTHGYGYGSFRFEGRMQDAHRFSWINTYGPIPDGLHVLHRCDIPPCINPDHLFLGTHADNVADMIRKRRIHRFARRPLLTSNGATQ